VRGTSTTGRAFGFTGEQTDAETALLHLRARHYNPATGRFLAADTVEPNAPGTQGFNRYAYLANNPTTLTDPGGQSALADISQWAIRVVIACALTGWCNDLQSYHFDYIAEGTAWLPRPKGALMIVGKVSAALITYLACGIDIKHDPGVGLKGLHLGDGDRCFKASAQSEGVRYGHGAVAGRCLETFIPCRRHSIAGVPEHDAALSGAVWISVWSRGR